MYRIGVSPRRTFDSFSKKKKNQSGIRSPSERKRAADDGRNHKSGGHVSVEGWPPRLFDSSFNFSINSKRRRDKHTDNMCRLVLSFSSYFFFIREPHIFSVYVTHSILSLFISFFVLKGGGGGWLQHALASCWLSHCLRRAAAATQHTKKVRKRKKIKCDTPKGRRQISLPSLSSPSLGVNYQQLGLFSLRRYTKPYNLQLAAKLNLPYFFVKFKKTLLPLSPFHTKKKHAWNHHDTICEHRKNLRKENTHFLFPFFFITQGAKIELQSFCFLFQSYPKCQSTFFFKFKQKRKAEMPFGLNLWRNFECTSRTFPFFLIYVY